ncbi:MAG: glycoside hydrolase family 38 C-terminal domain-containing protein [Ilumatobacteraceae bacterium]
MHDRHVITEKRLERFLSERIRPARYGASAPFTVTAYAVAGEPISFNEVMLAMVDGQFEPFPIGSPYGKAWSTTWFHCSGRVPDEWAGSTVEARIDLGFGLAPGFQSEGLVWGPVGPLRALNPLNHSIPLLISARGGEEFEFLVEAAANPMIGGPVYRPTPLGDQATLPETLLYALKRAELTVFEPEVAALVHDLDILGDLIRELPLNQPRRPQITVAIGRALDALDYDDVAGTAPQGRAELAEMLARPAVPSAHHVSAIGHAHIDTAWLWPLRETVRKCARTFSNALDLMTREPELKFVCSQAQQHEWMREHFPSIFAGMQAQAGQGRFIPVGGMWVEADMNLPSGESLARQFLHGQGFFEEHYGTTCDEVWIPDVFGYPASAPQIFRLGGASYFLTQKLSWNKQNRMPHHSFWWQGLDGTQMFTHFPPVDTYNVSMKPFEMAHAERNYADHGGGTMSMAPFGFGNGGGGPTREMMERYKRMRNLEGLPTISIESPADFFAAAVDDYPDAPTWVGELYFEMHRGTYTSQAKTKLGNRRSEVLLGEVELWSTLASTTAEMPYPADELRRIWREVLTLQFHDIIPGSSIAWVHDDAEAIYARVGQSLQSLRSRSLAALTGSVGGSVMLANSAPHARAEVMCLPPSLASAMSDAADGLTQTLGDGTVALYADLAAMSVTGIDVGSLVAAPDVITAELDDGMIHVENGLIDVLIDSDGLITSIYDKRADREVITDGQRANVLELSTDHPIEYDAWDLDEYYANNTVDLTDADSVEIIDAGPMVVSVRVQRSFGASQITQTIVVRAGSARLDVINNVSWYEDEKVLKVAFPVDVHADVANCEIQFGHVPRPTHASTNWDAAKFEICAHRWIDVSEHGYGVALLNDCKYGHDVHRGALRLTLLRASNFPDPDADRGEQRFTYSLLPHLGGLVEGEVIAEGIRLNQPVIAIAGSGRSVLAPVVAVESSDPGVVVSAVKLAEDGSGDVIVRCYESTGGRRVALLASAFVTTDVIVTDFLERALPDEQGAAVVDDRGVQVVLRPFQILTIRLAPAT